MGLLSRQLLLSLLWLLICGQIPTPISASKKSYVVYLDGQHQGEDHHEFLGSFLGSEEKAREAILYSYTKHINGFAALLHDDELAKLSNSPSVLSVLPNSVHELQTTHSMEFLGLEEDGAAPPDGLWTKAGWGEDIIIGSLDSGVWPESESFADSGLGPVPRKWRGACESNRSDPIRCNRKLLGVRLFSKGFVASRGEQNPGDTDTARDVNGHGTHTLATAAGRLVSGASVSGLGSGTAKGAAPRARVAAYKVCFGKSKSFACTDTDILAAIEQAIDDGVDVLSIPIGAEPVDYLASNIAIGSFHAVKNGITVVCAAGNTGPRMGTVMNVAPWIITVAASTMDREFTSYAILGNGERLKGQSLSASGLPAYQSFPLISGADAPALNSANATSLLCPTGSLDPAKVKGKIVVCMQGSVSNKEKGQTVRLAGGIGVIIANTFESGYDVAADPHVIPGLSVSYEDGEVLFEYLQSSTSPTASIKKPWTDLRTEPAPFMASFSSRGPNSIDPGILKPDITAPGVNVLSPYTKAVERSGNSLDTRLVEFNVLSGTSVSCAHVAGVIALLKARHEFWSPATIKSALMTTATTIDNQGSSILDSSFDVATPFSYGAGHVRPTQAMDPGLVYNLLPADYINFLCAIGYNAKQIAKFDEKAAACPPSRPRLVDFNYPSISVPRLSGSVTVTRKLMNVGLPAKYRARVVPPENVVVTVSPRTLVFNKIGVELAFNVTLAAEVEGQVGKFGWLIWWDGVHTVRSPIVVNFDEDAAM